MLWLYEREINPEFALVLKNYNESGWFMEQLDRIYRKKSIENSLINTLNYQQAHIGSISKEGNKNLQEWVRKQKMEVAELSKEQTVWDKLRKTKPKPTIWDRFKKKR